MRGKTCPNLYSVTIQVSIKHLSSHLKSGFAEFGYVAIDYHHGRILIEVKGCM